jgi:TatD DNase family protein
MTTAQEIHAPTEFAEWVDFHCHLDLYPDPVQVAREAEQNGVRTLAVTTTPRAWPREREMFAHLKLVRLALGLHPELVDQHAGEITLWERYLDETRYVGEVGLDSRPRARSSLPEQRAIFRRVLDTCAEHGGKILTVHSAGIPGETVRMIADHLQPDRGRVVLHWFTGGTAPMTVAARHGCYFSINASMLRSERGRSLIKAIPRDRILTETDGPFTQTAHAPARPRDIVHTVDQLAAFLHLAPKILAEQIRDNLRNLLSP